MRPGRPTPVLLLTKGERDKLQAWTRQPKCPQGLALRARVILLCANGHSNTETAAELRITIQTVGKWRQRFIDKRLDGLLDEPRSGTPRRLSEADVDRVLGLTLGIGAKPWRLLVDAIVGGGQRNKPGQRSSHLESVLAAATSCGSS